MIVATDGREQSDAAIRAGALLAGRSDAWFVLTVVSPLPITAPELDLRIAAEAVAVHRETQVQAVHDQVRRILGEREVRVEALDGNPADVIARTAREFKLEGFELTVDEAVLDHIVGDALRRETGARGLASTLTRSLEDVAFGSFGVEAGGQVHVIIRDDDIAVEID